MTPGQFQGNPCKRGHSGLRWRCNGGCVKCVAVANNCPEWRRLYDKAYVERVKNDVVKIKRRRAQAAERARRYRARHSFVIEERRAHRQAVAWNTVREIYYAGMR
jgi:hypothetical protein